ncbi:MAG: hypothetical protein WBE26_19045, partial [Phycisphaerae bacterium]
MIETGAMRNAERSTHVRKKTRLRRWTLRGAALASALLVCELALQCAVLLLPRVRHALMPPHRQDSVKTHHIPRFLHDPTALGHRGNPKHPSHDRLGFPNAEVLESADIVVVGDSQTYGPLDSPHQAWPVILGHLAGAGTYNMGSPGWGPVEQLLTLDLALERDPAIIMLGFYL